MLVCIHPYDLDIYERLAQNYEAEFSLITKKMPNVHALYEITPVTSPYEGYLYHHGKIPAGFAVVDTSRERFDVAEFYIVPSLRRSGIGHRLAEEIFRLYEGPWQVRQIMGAEKARAFWVAVISNFTSGEFTDGREKDEEWGEVYIQRFTSESKKS